MRFEGKVAIVTGAAKGIGWGIATVLAKEGAKVTVVDWDEQAGEATAAEIRQSGRDAFFFKCDVSKEDQVKAMVQATVDRWGRIDVLVNNAGIGVYMPVLEATEADWDRCLGVNVKGIAFCSKHCIPHMQKVGKGAIVNISSVHSFANVNGTSPYAASKGAATALTRSMAMDYSPTIRVNSVAPGWVLTPLIQGIFDSYPDPAAQQRLVEQRQVMKRIGRPEDIGNAVAFLASDEASFITGTQLYVDGGLTAQLESW
ncbi:MAG: SDR family oxidoreductase [Chloroflexi bacterium]|nr:SDR family oxidoreductase [Chloroflexota bacterium]